ncbi:MAG: hypothetical protein AB2A00_30740 [Myxococcota bacterium]
MDRFTWSFASFADAREAVNTHLKHGGLFASLKETLALRAPVQVDVLLPGGASFSFKGEAVHSDGENVTVVLDGTQGAALTALNEALAAGPQDAPTTPPALTRYVEPAPVVTEAEDEEADDAKPTIAERPLRQRLRVTEKVTDDQSAWGRIKEMRPEEKVLAALKGDRTMRFHLLKDPNKNLHIQVLRNPGIMMEEVEQAAKMPTLSVEALKYIAQNKEWMRHSSVVVALVRNPQTPVPMATELCGKLRPDELRAIAKSSSVRSAVAAAARKHLL